MGFSRRLVLLCALLCAGLVAVVPVAAAQAQETAQRAPADIDPNSLANGALQVLQMIDQGQAGEAWDGASAVTKRASTREEFMANVAKTRTSQGTPTGRAWILVRRQETQGNENVPAGLYASIEFITGFQGGKQQKVELVTLRKDEDGRWRFAGYTIR